MRINRNRLGLSGGCCVGFVAAAMAMSAAAAMAMSAAAAWAQPPALVSGQPIPVATSDRTGPLASGMSTYVVGYASVCGGAEPDLFLATGLHSSKPGLFLYRWVKRSADGAPVFGQPVEVDVPFSSKKGNLPPQGVIFQTADGKVHGWWLVKGAVERTVFDAEKRRFDSSPAGKIRVKGLPAKPANLQDISVELSPDGSVRLLAAVGDGVSFSPAGGLNHRDPNYRPYDAADVYRGGWPFTSLFEGKLASPMSDGEVTLRQLSATRQESLRGYGQLTSVNLGPGRERDVITGSHFGDFYYYHRPAGSTDATIKQLLVASPSGRALRSLAIAPAPQAYPNPKTHLSDLLVGGQCWISYYRFTGRFTPAGAPIYDDPQPLLEQDAILRTGSLPVVNVADWDGDGALDIVLGNSEGKVLWFRNAGSNLRPAFLPGAEVKAGGRPIHIQPGYHDVQGPGEARWGYCSPTVADWNQDGLPDILLSSATAEHRVLLNKGTAQSPDLDAAMPLYCHGLDLHGTWRVKPGVAKMGSGMVYVALDDQDEFHLYRRIDDFNLEDCGKLRLEDGSTIRANFLAAGGTGRSKFLVADWDGDGKIDLLVGTPRHGSIPNPLTGLPKSLGLKGAAVVFLRNVGTNELPVYAAPTLMKFRGKPIYLGQHECSPALWTPAAGAKPDLIVGMEEGTLIYYARKDLSWDSDAVPAAKSVPGPSAQDQKDSE